MGTESDVIGFMDSTANVMVQKVYGECETEVGGGRKLEAV
jgi:hypothetical protein